MAEKITIARPYARALFKEASDNGLLQEWLQIVTVLAEVAKNPQVLSLLGNPRVKTEQLVDIFLATIQQSAHASKLQTSARNFVTLLAEAKRLALLPDILTLYQALLAERENITQVEVISAQEIGNGLRDKIQSNLEKKFASKVLIEYHIDESLIGGAIIRTGNQVIDGSIRYKLNRLAESLQL